MLDPIIAKAAGWVLTTLFVILLGLLTYLWNDSRNATRKEMARIDEKVDRDYQSCHNTVMKLEGKVETMGRTLSADNLEHRDRLASVVDNLWKEMKQFHADHARSQEEFFARLALLDEKYNRLALAQAKDYLTKRETADMFKQQIAPLIVKLDQLNQRPAP